MTMGETIAMLGAGWRSTLSVSTLAGQAEEPPADGRRFTDITRDVILNDAPSTSFWFPNCYLNSGKLGRSRGTAAGKGD